MHDDIEKILVCTIIYFSGEYTSSVLLEVERSFESYLSLRIVFKKRAIEDARASCGRVNKVR